MPTELLECDRCRRPARRRALYARGRLGAAVLVGRFGGRCFYMEALAIADQGITPEHEDARRIRLRKGRRP